MRHEHYSIWSLDRASARYYRFDVNACHSTPVEHAARFFYHHQLRSALSFRTFAIHKCFFSAKVLGISIALTVFSTRTKGGESNEKRKITFSRPDSSR